MMTLPGLTEKDIVDINSQNVLFSSDLYYPIKGHSDTVNGLQQSRIKKKNHKSINTLNIKKYN